MEIDIKSRKPDTSDTTNLRSDTLRRIAETHQYIGPRTPIENSAAWQLLRSPNLSIVS